MEKQRVTGSIYIDDKTGSAIIVKKGDNNSYSFYATKVEGNAGIHDIDFSNLKPISNIFDYIDENNIEINSYSKEILGFGEKKSGK